MPNSLYNQIFSQEQMNRLFQDAQNLKNSFKGNPRDEVQRLLNEGIMAQDDFNRLFPLAQQIAAMMPKR